MKKQLVKRIQAQAEKRADLARSGHDEKRHDRVKSPEKKQMNSLCSYYQAQGLEREDAIKKVARDLVRDPETVARHLTNVSEANKQVAVSKKAQIEETPKAEEAPPTGGSAPLPVVYQDAWREHVAKLKAVAQQLMNQLALPQPHELGSWVPPQESGHHVHLVWTGTPSFSLRGCSSEPKADGPGDLCLEVEGDTLYFPALQAHIPDQELWKNFGAWKLKAATLLSNCQQLALRLVDECKSATGSTRLLISQEWPQEGIFWRFVATVYMHHLFLAEDYAGLAESEYLPGRYPSREKTQGDVHALWFGGDGIACHQELKALKQWKAVHQKMLAKCAVASDAGKLLVAYNKELGALGDTIRRVLRIEVERGTFDRGRCGLCPTPSSPS